MSEAFVYCWTDFGTNKLYVGVHKGIPDDGYVCSSKLMLEEYTKRPNDFSRQVLASGTYPEMYVFEQAILKASKADKDPGFYNQALGHGPFYSHGPMPENYKLKHKKSWLGKKRPEFSVSWKENMSSSHKGLLHSEETKTKIGISHAKKYNWIITTPQGKVETIINLSKYCRGNDLNIGHMSSRGKTKGFLCEKVVLNAD